MSNECLDNELVKALALKLEVLACLLVGEGGDLAYNNHVGLRQLVFNGEPEMAARVVNKFNFTVPAFDFLPCYNERAQKRINIFLAYAITAKEES